MSEAFEVPEPILNAPFSEPGRHWYIREGHEPQQREGRRPSIVFPPRDQRNEWDTSDGTLRKSQEYAGFELALVNRVRQQVKAWRAAGYPGATRTTLDLLAWWQRDGRRQPLFFAQREAAETIIFLQEARTDFLQGVNVPREEVSEEQQAKGFTGFARYACKMATGSGKTTVMAMIAAWSILNKVHSRGNAKFSDVVLVVCPNVTIRSRLAELDPELGEASVYWSRDLVPPDMRADLTQGRVLVTNWHVFERKATQIGGQTARVNKTGVRESWRDMVYIGAKTTTARGKKYLSVEDYEAQSIKGYLNVLRENRDESGHVVSALVQFEQYVMSDTALINHVLGREVGGKKNILVLNDEAHHAYRIKRKESEEEEEDDDNFSDDEDAERYFKEATVWIDGLDRINKLRGINFCLDLSATPYYLGRVGQDTNRPFPWVVSDFGLVEAIESGLTKIPQLAVRDSTGADIPGYFNIWEWILPQLTTRERGGGRNPQPEAIIKVRQPSDCDSGGDVAEAIRAAARERRRATAGVHPGLQEHANCQGAARMDRGKQPTHRSAAAACARIREHGNDDVHHPRRLEGGQRNRRLGREQGRQLALDALDARYRGAARLAARPPGPPDLSRGFSRGGREAWPRAASARPGCALHRERGHAHGGVGLQHGDAYRRPAAVHVSTALRAGRGARTASHELRSR